MVASKLQRLTTTRSESTLSQQRLLKELKVRQAFMLTRDVLKVSHKIGSVQITGEFCDHN